MSDRFRFSAIAHATHTLMSPLSPSALDRLLSHLDGIGASAVAVDLGCGHAEVLLRLMERTGCRGVGVDCSPRMIEVAASRAAARGLTPVFVTREMEHFTESGFDVVLCLGALPGESPRDSLDAVARHARPGGALLVGAGYWKQDPADEYLERLGAARSELLSHDALLRTVSELGFRTIETHESTLEEWDEYENRYARTMEAYCAAHPEDADVPQWVTRIAKWRETYARWGRDTLGFVTLLLTRPR